MKRDKFSSVYFPQRKICGTPPIQLAESVQQQQSERKAPKRK